MERQRGTKMGKMRALLLIDFDGDIATAAEIEKNLKAIAEMVYDAENDTVGRNKKELMPKRIVPKDYDEYIYADCVVRERRGDSKPDLRKLKIRTS